MQLKHSATVLAALFVLPLAAEAGFIGQTNVTTQYRFPDQTTAYPQVTPASPTPFTIVPGLNASATILVENVTGIAFSFTDNTVTIDFTTVLQNPTWNVVPFNGVVLTLPSGHGFSGASVTSTTMANFTDSRLSVTPTEFRFNWNGLSYVNGTRIVVQAVPEPVGLALLAFGAAAAGLRRRI
jgi:hypothetical protein